MALAVVGGVAVLPDGVVPPAGVWPGFGETEGEGEGFGLVVGDAAGDAEEEADDFAYSCAAATRESRRVRSVDNTRTMATVSTFNEAASSNPNSRTIN